MRKNLGSLWLKSFQRASKIQQSQGRKLFKSLLSTAVAKPPARRVKALIPADPVKKSRKVLPRPGAATGLAHAMPGLPGLWHKGWFASPAHGRTPATRMMYWLYQPSRAVTAPRPLVVMLHGCQQSACDFAAATRMNQLAERKGFVVLYPQQSSSADAHRCWHWYQRATQQGQGDVRLVAEMIAQLQQRPGMDPSRTYLAGLSAGAALASLVALHHPDLVAALGLHSAPVFGTSDSPITAYRAMQHGAASHRIVAQAFARHPAFLAGASGQSHKPGMPVMLIHGTRDSVVRPVNARQLATQWAIVNAAAISRAEPVIRHQPARIGGRSPQHAYQTTSSYAGRKPQVVICDVQGLGHAWSGGAARIPFSAPEGPSATLLLWDFFARHQRATNA